MARFNKHPSIIILSANSLNSPSKRHTLEEWMKKQDPSTCCLQDTQLIGKESHRVKVKG